ncbi:YeeE/YedE family protein [Gellertiella hungarica]|uniref:Sulphur transport domain-containing protein n=1 Tax=Gellertiella hungarica TaxID=1572859 RepID=A0A7W6J211_9HYPH|nr:YeeE/YedE thiosulfate transporter family protein [Gellertiella hungarica]MBB4063313.1 hypothetical protein [Gellertiella hungarica]
MEPLHPLWPLAGGALIGLSAGLYLLLAGRVAGISELAAGATGLSRRGFRPQAAIFVLGLIGGAWLAAHFVRMPEVVLPVPALPLAVAGLLVGFGSRLGSGCTSGHGVCGMARLSKRSIVATLTFMATAMVTVFIVRHGLGGF